LDQDEGSVCFVEVDQVCSGLLFKLQLVRHDNGQADGRDRSLLEDLCGKWQIPDGVESRKRREIRYDGRVLPHICLGQAPKKGTRLGVSGDQASNCSVSVPAMESAGPGV